MAKFPFYEIAKVKKKASAIKKSPFTGDLRLSG